MEEGPGEEVLLKSRNQHRPNNGQKQYWVAVIIIIMLVAIAVLVPAGLADRTIPRISRTIIG
jgi:hypothetical protein